MIEVLGCYTTAHTANSHEYIQVNGHKQNF
jgi:hypothetical protein